MMSVSVHRCRVKTTVKEFEYYYNGRFKMHQSEKDVNVQPLHCFDLVTPVSL